MDKNLAIKILVSILLSWDQAKPKAVAVDALQRAADVPGPTFVETVNALAKAGRVHTVQGATFIRITPTGAHWLYSECLGLSDWKEWPELRPGVREEIAKFIGEYYTGSQIGAFLQRIGLAGAGWQGGMTKWKELLGIIEQWHGTPHVLIYYVVVSFLERANLARLDDDEWRGIHSGLNKILGAQGIAVSADGRVVRSGHEDAKNRGVTSETIAAADTYRWHPNELNALAEALTSHSGCRTRKDGQLWMEKATSNSPPPLKGEGETLVDYWRRSLDVVLERQGSAGLLAILSLLADPREHLGQGDAAHVHEKLNHALEWSPLRVEHGGAISPRRSRSPEPTKDQHSRTTEVRGVPVTESAVRTFLERADEDEATTVLIAPLLRMSGFLDVSVKGHRDKSGEFGQDIRQLKLSLPTGHSLFFAVQVKAGDINSDARGQKSNIALVLTQARMALGKKNLDAATQTAVAINHVLLIATGHITESARVFLHEQLADGNREVLLIDRDRLVEMATRFGLPAEYAAKIDGSNA